ncbi:MAG: hypothetical protein ACR2P0_09385 [Acidimicrobiales bacterium]
MLQRGVCKDMGTQMMAGGRQGESSHAPDRDLSIDDQQIVITHSDRREPAPIDDPLANLRGLLRRWRLLVVGVLLGALLGWLSAAVAEEATTAPIAVDHYQATHVLVVDNNIPDSQVVLSVRNLNALATRITVGEIPERVAARTGLSPADAASGVRVVIRPDSESIEIITIAETPSTAEALADAYSAEIFGYLSDEAEAYAEDAITAAELRLDEAELNLARVRSELNVATAVGDGSRVDLLEQDEQQFLSARIFANAALLDARSDGVPLVPLETLETADGTASVISTSRFDDLSARAAIGDNIEVIYGDEENGSGDGALSAVSSRLPAGAPVRVGIGAGLGLVVALAAAAALARLDNRVRSKEQVEAAIDLPVIAEVPTMPNSVRETEGVYSCAAPRTRFAEQYRALASVVGYARRSRPTDRAQIVLVSSPGPSEGKTTTVANLGAMLAETGLRVLLLNCDFRRPKLHRLVGGTDTPLRVSRTSVPGVEMISHVVNDPDASPAQVVTAQREVIRRAAARYDVVIIDTAPLLATNDAVDLLDLVDDVILVVRGGATKLQAADRAAEVLERRRAHVLGVAITASNTSGVEYYRYGSYYTEDEVRASTPTARPAAAVTTEPRSPSPARPRTRPESAARPRGRWVQTVDADPVSFGGEPESG